MQQLLSNLEDERQRQFRRLVGVSAALHVVFVLAFWIGPIRRSGPVLPAVVRVNLVEALATAPAARPAPAALPKPLPPPPPPPVAKKVLPKQPAPLPKPKPVEAKPKPAEPKPKVEPKPEPKAKEPEPAPEQELDDVLAQLRNEAGETAPKPVEQPAALPGGGPAGGPGIVVDPETARWMREVKIHVTRAWILAPGFRSEALLTIVEVDLSPTGEVLGTSTQQSSGNPWYDESVERAIQKASPVPAPPEAGEWQFSFDSREQL
jgi:TonB family protein